jgi:hypothetical protein
MLLNVVRVVGWFSLFGTWNWKVRLRYMHTLEQQVSKIEGLVDTRVLKEPN